MVIEQFKLVLTHELIFDDSQKVGIDEPITISYVIPSVKGKLSVVQRKEVLMTMLLSMKDQIMRVEDE